ncbi:3'(2'),5'-bisphosphate nucleotidase CysQ [Roseibium sp.]|uniref:3'(2'),5'-bisphosphate nucleotidase CysQ n=1 Tax=Roseibium sp. TaxID=1936156 RepID=UPI003B512DB5
MSDTQFVCSLAVAAGAEILKIYAEPFERFEKADGSPVTVADEAGEKVILEGLSRRFPDIPIIAEEAVEAGLLPQTGSRYFLVDPLDGTKEFLKKNGEFTVNIALIEDGVPVFGVVLAPALDEIYWGGSLDGSSIGAFKGRIENGSIIDAKPIAVRAVPEMGLSIVASRSHMSDETATLISTLDVAETVSVGSSLKLCLVAEGKADLYPRLAPTMQWDIAAGDAVVRAAGGKVVYAASGEDFIYEVPESAEKIDLLNPHFLAVSEVGLLSGLAPAA